MTLLQCDIIMTLLPCASWGLVFVEVDNYDYVIVLYAPTWLKAVFIEFSLFIDMFRVALTKIII